MYIKLRGLAGLYFNFHIISVINKLYQIKASFTNFQLSPFLMSTLKSVNYKLKLFKQLRKYQIHQYPITLRKFKTDE